jgi:hypothetical protein
VTIDTTHAWGFRLERLLRLRLRLRLRGETQTCTVTGTASLTKAGSAISRQALRRTGARWTAALWRYSYQQVLYWLPCLGVGGRPTWLHETTRRRSLYCPYAVVHPSSMAATPIASTTTPPRSKKNNENLVSSGHMNYEGPEGAMPCQALERRWPC